MPAAPHVVLCNMVCAGSSAIDPIFKELLPDLGYALTPFGPEASHRLPEQLGGAHPVYHWSHDPVETFAPLFNEHELRVVYLYRDPRDVLVSLTKDHMHRELHPGLGEKQVMLSLLQAELPRWVDVARAWLAQDQTRVMPLTFDAMKADTAGTVRRCLEFAGLEVADDVLAAAVDKHSFENVAGRKRGESGPTLRTGYMLRKGVSGDWRNHFDGEITMRFAAAVGGSVVEFGFEEDDSWLCEHLEALLAARQAGAAETISA